LIVFSVVGVTFYIERRLSYPLKEEILAKCFAKWIWIVIKQN